MSPSFGMLVTSSSNHRRESRNNSSDNSGGPGRETRDMPLASPTPSKALCVANIFKYDKAEKLGLNLKFSSTMGRIYVSDIKRNSKFSDTPLQIGMVLLTVNGQPCPRTVKETATFIKSIEGDLTLVACSLKNTTNTTNTQAEEANTNNQKKKSHNNHNNIQKKKNVDENVDRNVNQNGRRLRLSECLGPTEDEGVETTLEDNIPRQIGRNNNNDDGYDDDSNPFSDLELYGNEGDGKRKASTTIAVDGKPLPTGAKRSSSDSGAPASAAPAAAAAATVSPTTATKRSASDSFYSPSKAAAARTSTGSAQSFYSSYGQEQMKSFTAAATNWLLGENAPEPKDDRKQAAKKTSAQNQNQHHQHQHDEEEKQEKGEQYHQYPPPPSGTAPPPPTLERNKQSAFFMTPGAYSIPGPASFARSSSRASSSTRASSAQESDDSSFLRSFYESGDFSDFDDDTDLEFAEDEGEGHPLDGILDIILKDDDDDDYEEEEDTNAAPSLRRPSQIERQIQRQKLVVAAELTTDAEAQIEDRLRRSILQDTAVASVVMVEHGGTTRQHDKYRNHSKRKQNNHRYNHKNVKEKLFGDGKKNSMEVILSGLEVSPDDYIRKRDLLPWTVKRNATTNLWVAYVQTNQKAWEQSSSNHERSLEQMRSCHTFSGATEEQAYEAGLAMAPPVMQPSSENPFCFLCKSKFAVFQRPKHCKNCGVVICSTCCCSWSSKRLPDTYRKKNSSGTVLVCMACDWVATNFQQALLRGNMSKALALYKTGNINLRTPYGPHNGGRNKKRQDEIMFPIHMAIIGGNLAMVQWLSLDRFVPMKRSTPLPSSSKRFSDNLVLRTSKGRSPIRLALGLEHSDILKFLVSNQKLNLLEEDLRMDYRKVLRHLTVLMETVPAAMLAQRNHLPASVEVASSEFQSSTGAPSAVDSMPQPSAQGGDGNDSIVPPGNHLLS
jgi:hypothetical protein